MQNSLNLGTGYPTAVVPYDRTRLPPGSYKNETFRSSRTRNLDDIFIYSTSIEEHEEHLKIVFEILRENHLFLSKDKIDLYSVHLDCLGHIIDDEGIHVDMDKMRSIRDWPTPRNYNDIQRFVGLVNYVAQFMPDITSYTSPLTGMSSQVMFT